MKNFWQLSRGKVETLCKEKVPDGRIDMKYVIHRLRSIPSRPGLDNYGKISLLEDFISELLETFGREGGDTFSKAPPDS